MEEKYLLYIVLCGIHTYIIFLFMKNIFGENRTSKFGVVLSYFTFFFVRGIIEFYGRIPIVLWSFNLFGMILLSMNYYGKLKKKIFYILLIFSIFLIIEGIVSLSIPSIHPSRYLIKDDISLKCEAISMLINYCTVLIIINYKKIFDGTKLPLSLWVMIFYVAISSFVIISLIYEANNIRVGMRIFAIILALGINFIVFYLYTSLSEIFEKEFQAKEIKRHNEYYKNELKIVQKNLQTMGVLRHDIKHHFTVIFGLVKENRNEECITYLEEIGSTFNLDKVLAKSGNVIIDSIINFKLYDLENKDVRLKINLKIPDEIHIPAFDIATLLGNLIDNAIEGVLSSEKDKFIEIYITQSKGMLNISIKNSFDGIFKEKKGKILSRKRDFNKSGTGMEQIRKVVNGYNGLLKYETSGNTFYIVVVIYIP